MDVEITVQAVSLPDGYPDAGARSFGPKAVQLHNVWGDHWEEVPLPSYTVGWDMMRLRFENFGRIDDEGWFAGRLTLSRYDGCTIGSPRPCMYFAGPCDTPMYTLFSSPHYGRWVVGLRSLLMDSAVRKGGRT